ncbi:nitroreductase [Porphyromonas miyakawae]|uniref:Nitroreductase n=1 Tax=Porphyromonas miyakawae TaxID=3137470 RepID=A0ABQ0E0M5_9PORP
MKLDSEKQVRIKQSILFSACVASVVLLLGSIGCTREKEQSKPTLTNEEKIALFKTRRSVRQYQDEMPSKELLALVTEAGSYAPSGLGKQSAKIVVVTNRAERDRLSRLNMNLRGGESDPFYGAPVVIVVLADKSVPTYLYDGSVVMDNMLNAAHALGLATCWVHGADVMFESKEGKQILKQWGIGDNYVGIANCIVGYAAGEIPQAAPRKADYIQWVE